MFWYLFLKVFVIYYSGEQFFFSVNLAWFMFYVLCLPFTTLILPVLSNNGKIKSSIAEFMFYVLAFIIIRDKSSGEYQNL